MFDFSTDSSSDKLTCHTSVNFIPNENPEKCKILAIVFSVFGEISGGCSECFFVLRTCALWKHNRFVFIAILTCFIVFVIARAGTSFTAIAIASYETSAIPGITGCRNSADLFVPFFLLFMFELGLMSLTLIRAIQGWRMAHGRLYVVLVKNNILYYMCGLFLSGVNVFASQYFPVREPLENRMAKTLIFRTPSTSTTPCSKVCLPADPCLAHAPASLADRPADTKHGLPRLYFFV
ncbi:hypothetical protein P692DRAFT_20954692 [Suillus brevipes Sb2]|nr:hypothetical protein P692DRAFT_20954692 [Suillus brevipes Sb2]